MARPKKSISEDQVEALASINCSYAEIAAVVGCDQSTLTRRFARVIEKGREQGKSSLKRAMWDIAVNKKNVTMCIWLSKQMLGYTDKVEQNVSSEVQTNVTYNTQFGNTNASTIQPASDTEENPPVTEKV